MLSVQEWFNYKPYLPEPIPPIKDLVDDYGSRIQKLEKVRVKKCLEQDADDNPDTVIPEDVLKEYHNIGRPTKLYRAKRLEEFLETPARIYFKREDQLPTLSFKLNSGLAQIYYAKQEDAKGVVTETGAGQWGLCVAYASNLYGIKGKIFWVKVSKERMPERVKLVEMLGTEVHSSPSSLTECGRKVLKNEPDCTGSLGTGIGDAVSFAMENEDWAYISGSNLPHVLLHQTVIGLETKQQLDNIGEVPDEIIACVGGGSNLGGLVLPFLPDKEKRGENLKLIGIESDAAPRLTKGEYKYDHADPIGYTPLALSYTLGMNYTPPPVYVGGLRQHNGSPIISLLKKHNMLDAYAYSQDEAFRAGRILVECERILPAPETCHAVKGVIDSALDAKKKKQSKVIVACLSGSGMLDIHAYTKVLGL